MFGGLRDAQDRHLTHCRLGVPVMTRFRYPVFAMAPDEELCFARAMEQWTASLKRPDLTDEDRVKGALLAYQRQAFALVLDADLASKRANATAMNPLPETGISIGGEQ